MSENKCENCKFFRELYKPPHPMFSDVPSGYVCLMPYATEGAEPQWLGTKNQDVRNGYCEMFITRGKEESIGESN